MISVVVSTLNRAALLGQALRSLMSQKGLSIPAEVVVVDNGSTDDTAALVAREGRTAPVPVRYLYEPRPGLSYARNAGSAAARGEVVAFLDDDAWAEPEWLAELWDVYATDPAVACVGGRIVLDWPDRPRPAWLRPSFWGLLGAYDLGPRRRDLGAGDLLPFGGNISFRRSVFEARGGFRTELGRRGARLGAGEEVELCVRVLRAGHRVVYAPDAVVHHLVLPHRLERGFFRRLARDSGMADTWVALARGESRVRLAARYGGLMARALAVWCLYGPLPARRFAARLTFERVLGKLHGLWL